MTVTSTELEAVTHKRYTVGSSDSDTITQDTFDLFHEWAKQEANDAGIAFAYYDRAVALAIADMVHQSFSSADKQSQNIGDTSYKRFDEESQYRKQFKRLVELSKANQSPQPSSGVQRSDAYMQRFSTDGKPLRTVRDYWV